MSNRPPTFEPAGLLHSASFASWIPSALAAPHRATGARYAGLLYERKMQAAFETQYHKHWLPSPWLAFRSKLQPTRVRYCQPDGVIFFLEESFAYVPEFKLKHTDLAWWQLHYLYIPVLEFIFPGLQFIGIEVCRWFDPSTHTSAPVHLCADFEAARRHQVQRSHPDLFVHIANPAHGVSAQASA